MLRQPSIAVLRGLLIVLIAVYAFALFLQWSPPVLSAEATQYQQMVEEVMSGIDLSYGLQKLGWLLGNAAGLIGAALMFLRIRYGLPLLIAGPALLTAAALLGAPPLGYPNLGRISLTTAWCASSALWGGVVTYALMGYGVLFSRRGNSG